MHGWPVVASLTQHNIAVGKKAGENGGEVVAPILVRARAVLCNRSNLSAGAALAFVVVVVFAFAAAACAV